MKSAVPFERAKVIIQNWFNDFCKFYGKPTAVLQISEKGNPQTGFYAITNPFNGKIQSVENPVKPGATHPLESRRSGG
jgi:hypothetical protein